MYSPKTARIAPQISPTEAYVFTASTIGYMRFSPACPSGFWQASVSRCEGRLHRGVVALDPRLVQPGDLRSLRRRIGAEDHRGILALVLELVDAHDHLAPFVDGFLVGVGRFLDLTLHVTGLDRGDGAAQVFDSFEVLARLLLEFLGQRLDVVRPAERVAVSVTPLSYAITCCVRTAIRCACSVGRASASS